MGEARLTGPNQSGAIDPSIGPRRGGRWSGRIPFSKCTGQARHILLSGNSWLGRRKPLSYVIKAPCDAVHDMGLPPQYSATSEDCAVPEGSNGSLGAEVSSPIDDQHDHTAHSNGDAHTTQDAGLPLGPGRKKASVLLLSSVAIVSCCTCPALSTPCAQTVFFTVSGVLRPS